MPPTPKPPPDSEKITLNLGPVDLGRIDLLVAQGFYANRTDLIRTAIRARLDRHEDAVQAACARDAFETGLRTLSRAELEAAAKAGTPLAVKVMGLVRIADDVTPELARRAIASVEVMGALHAPRAVREAIADRIK